MLLQTYRARLIFYTLLLMAFLTGTLGYVFYYSRSIILEEVTNSMESTSRLLTDNVEREEKELLHYAEIVRDDLRVQEYMFMITKVGTDSEALEKIYQRHFGWLPVKHYIFVSNEGHILLGDPQKELAQAVLSQMRFAVGSIFYFQGENGLELVTWAPISYQNRTLGAIALTRTLDKSWLEQHRLQSGGNLFIEQNNTIKLSTLPESIGRSFIPRGGRIALDSEIYRVSPIPLTGEGKKTPHLWHGVSENELLAKLESQSQLILLFAILGCMAILGMGFMIIRNFSQPLSRLMQITQAVAQGTLPKLDKSVENNEIDTLANRFAEMLQALREQQDEIKKAHKQLEESAIMDSLTELYNRRYLKQAFPKVLAQAQRENHFLSGLMLDLDHFKEINDNYGHLLGDQCLVHMAQLLKQISRASDYVFRVGGEEFLILSIDDNPNGGAILAEKIRAALEKSPCVTEKHTIAMTTSIGVSRTDNQTTADTALTHLLFQADKALYQAKGNGRNQVAIYKSENPLNKQVHDSVL
jgi:diguanylate cyclase (GGDEF)-like protein